MSFLGSIHIDLVCQDNRVTEVRLTPEREVHPEKLFIGKTVSAVRSLIPSLYALCPDSQLAAFELAVAMAKDRVISQELLHRIRWINHLEMIGESLRYFVLELGNPDYRTDKMAALLKARDDIAALKKLDPHDWEEVEHLWVELRSAASYILLDGFPTDWQQAALNSTLSATTDSLTEVFVRYGRVRSLGYCSYPYEPRIGFHLLNYNLELESWNSYPWSVKLNGMTGAVARFAHTPLVSGLLTQDGNTAYTRLVARFLQTLQAVDTTHADESSVAAVDIGHGKAASLIENARGALIHSVEFVRNSDPNDPTIRHYEILTPTELNFTYSDAAPRALKGIRFTDDEDLKEKAEIVFCSFDPCAEYSIGVIHA